MSLVYRYISQKRGLKLRLKKSMSKKIKEKKIEIRKPVWILDRGTFSEFYSPFLLNAHSPPEHTTLTKGK